MLPIKPKALKDARILVIEDERIIREILIRFLTALGVKEVDDFSTAESGWEAVVVKGKPYDVLVVDLVLPGASGATFIKKLRELPAPRAKTITIVVLTGDNSQATFKQLEPYNISAYLIKPVSQDVLKGALEKALSGHIARTTPVRSPVIHDKH
ncbi:MAG: response regulator [Rhodospirillaceae bacterium]|nr:response regulator [Rhodospirillaceae bacterium]